MADLTLEDVLKSLQDGKMCGGECNEIKSYDNFWVNKQSKDGYQDLCKKCYGDRYYKTKEKPIVTIKDLSVDEKILMSWCAGFLDGEGCFTLLGLKGSHDLYRTCSVTAAQVKKEPLDKLVYVLGGKIGYNGNTAFQWRIQDRLEIQNTVPYLLPYLVNKKREAEIVLEFASLNDGGRGRAYSKDGIVIREKLINELAAIRS